MAVIGADHGAGFRWPGAAHHAPVWSYDRRRRSGGCRRAEVADCGSWPGACAMWTGGASGCAGSRRCCIPAREWALAWQQAAWWGQNPTRGVAPGRGGDRAGRPDGRCSITATTAGPAPCPARPRARCAGRDQQRAARWRAAGADAVSGPGHQRASEPRLGPSDAGSGRIMMSAPPFDRHARCTERQRGAALLLAMMTVALVATLAATALWQQWRGVEIEARERERLQASWILIGALDWARLILREDARSGGADHLAEPWSIALREARLSTFLAMDSGDSDIGRQRLPVGPDHRRAGAAERHQPDRRQPGLASPICRRSSGCSCRWASSRAELERLGCQPAAGGWQQRRRPTTPSVPIPAPSASRNCAGWACPPSACAVLEPYVVVLPTRTPGQSQHGPAEVIAARIPASTCRTRATWSSARAARHFGRLTDAPEALAADAGRSIPARSAWRRAFSRCSGRLRLHDTEVFERSLVQRNGMSGHHRLARTHGARPRTTRRRWR